MLTLGRTLGLTPIKCEAKEGTDKLKEIHYQINDVLYKNSGKYIFQSHAERLYNQLCDYGKRLASLEVPDKANPKKSELLTKLRTICNSLKVYKKQAQTSEDVKEMQSAINWLLHRFIEAKDNITDEQALELLKETKELSDAVYPWEEELKLTNLVKMNRQLINLITTKYQL
jgi:hypothetical protein